MDVRLTLAALVPSPNFSGSLTANTQRAYERITWLDERPKPSWDALAAKWPEVESTLTPTDADRAEAVARGNMALLALGRIVTNNNALSEDELVAALRAKLP